MARGWESKSVEAQQAEAIDASRKPHAKLSAQEAALLRAKESLHLSRQRVLQQIQASRNAQHHKLLQRALADLEERLKNLSK